MPARFVTTSLVTQRAGIAARFVTLVKKRAVVTKRAATAVVRLDRLGAVVRLRTVGRLVTVDRLWTVERLRAVDRLRVYSSAGVCRLAVRWLAICITMPLIHCPGDGHLGTA